MVEGHRIQLIRFPEAETAAWHPIHDLDEKRLLRLQCQLIAYKLVIIDELGYLPRS
jgi:DNA replication protein DnaC